MEVGDSQNGNGKEKRKDDTYQQWTLDDSNLLLGLLAEALKNGLRDANESLSQLNIDPIEEEYASSSSPIVEEELEELVSQTQEQQREEANACRLNIANHM
ncbi:hypothetical protein Dsin_018957 [Dipteronia sinensis]|uniref:Uncharacterized protein n=1 Tax=Dipteronia sinensis TaxID=43782 RepID=A0AAE0E2J4_9ROSI|nr:hypothetical protein Dsin_018957 [Dipteronia sinensis]